MSIRPRSRGAIWEIVTDNFDFDLDAGDHQINNHADVQAQAQVYFDLMADGSVMGDQWNLETFVNGGQDLVAVSPIPVPAGGLLLATGRAGLVLRRRKTAA